MEGGRREYLGVSIIMKERWLLLVIMAMLFDILSENEQEYALTTEVVKFVKNVASQR